MAIISEREAKQLAYNNLVTDYNNFFKSEVTRIEDIVTDIEKRAKRNEEWGWLTLPGAFLFDAMKGITEGVFDMFTGGVTMGMNFARDVAAIFDETDGTKWYDDLTYTIFRPFVEGTESLLSFGAGFAADIGTIFGGNTDWAYGEQGFIQAVNAWGDRVEGGVRSGDFWKGEGNYNFTKTTFSPGHESPLDTSVDQEDKNILNNYYATEGFGKGVEFNQGIVEFNNFMSGIRDWTVNRVDPLLGLGETTDAFAPYAPEKAEIFRQGFRSIGRIIPSVVIANVGGKFGLNPQQAGMASQAYFFSSIYGASFDEALKNGATLDDAHTYALGNASIEMVAEGIGGFAFEAFNPKVGFAQLLKDVLSEGSEEAFSELGSRGLSQYSKGDGKIDTSETTLELWQRVGFSAAMGGFSGGIFGGVQLLNANVSKQGKANKIYEGFEKGEGEKLKSGFASTINMLQNPKVDAKTKENLFKNNPYLAEFISVEKKDGKTTYSLTDKGSRIQSGDFAAKQGDVQISKKTHLVGKDKFLFDYQTEVEISKNGTAKIFDIEIATKEDYANMNEKQKNDVDFFTKGNTDVVFVKSDGDFRSFYDAENDVTYVNIDNPNGYKNAFAHEVFHKVTKMAKEGILNGEQVKAYNTMLTFLSNNLTSFNSFLSENGYDFDLGFYEEQYKSLENKEEMIAEEQFAAFIEQFFDNSTLLNNLMSAEPSLFEKLKSIFSGKATFSKLAANLGLTKSNAQKYKKQIGYLAKMQNAFAKTLVKESRVSTETKVAQNIFAAGDSKLKALEDELSTLRKTIKETSRKAGKEIRVQEVKKMLDLMQEGFNTLEEKLAAISTYERPENEDGSSQRYEANENFIDVLGNFENSNGEYLFEQMLETLEDNYISTKTAENWTNKLENLSSYDWQDFYNSFIPDIKNGKVSASDISTDFEDMLEELSSLASKPNLFASLNTEKFVSEFEKIKEKIEDKEDEIRAYKSTVKKAETEKTLDKSEEKGIKSNYEKDNIKRVRNTIEAIESGKYRINPERFQGQSETIREVFNDAISSARDTSRLGIVDREKFAYFTNVDGDFFYKTFKNIHEKYDKADQVIVDLPSEKDKNLYSLDNGKSFVAINGSAVVFVENSGNMISLGSFYSLKNGISGVSKDLVNLAVENGATHGDAMFSRKKTSIPLPFVYSKYGFKVVSKVKFNVDVLKENHPDKWEDFIEKHGESDIVFFVYVGTNAPLYKSVGEMFEDIDKLPYSEWEDAVAIQQKLVKPVKEVSDEVKIKEDKDAYKHIDGSEGSVTFSTSDGHIEILKYKNALPSIIDFFVKEEKRGKGVGKKLFGEAMKMFKNGLRGQFSSEVSISIAKSFGLVAYDIKGNKLSDKGIKQEFIKHESLYMETPAKKTEKIVSEAKETQTQVQKFYAAVLKIYKKLEQDLKTKKEGEYFSIDIDMIWAMSKNIRDNFDLFGTPEQIDKAKKAYSISLRLIGIADKNKDTSRFVRSTAEQVFDMLSQHRELLSFLKKQDVVVEAVVEKKQEKVVEKPKKVEKKAKPKNVQKTENKVELKKEKKTEPKVELKAEPKVEPKVKKVYEPVVLTFEEQAKKINDKTKYFREKIAKGKPTEFKERSFTKGVREAAISGVSEANLPQVEQALAKLEKIALAALKANTAKQQNKILDEIDNVFVEIANARGVETVQPKAEATTVSTASIEKLATLVAKALEPKVIKETKVKKAEVVEKKKPEVVEKKKPEVVEKKKEEKPKAKKEVIKTSVAEINQNIEKIETVIEKGDFLDEAEKIEVMETLESNSKLKFEDKNASVVFNFLSKNSKKQTMKNYEKNEANFSEKYEEIKEFSSKNKATNPIANFINSLIKDLGYTIEKQHSDYQVMNHMASTTVKQVILNLYELSLKNQEQNKATLDFLTKDLAKIVRDVNAAIFSELDYSDKKLLVEINKEESNPKGFLHTRAIYWYLRDLKNAEKWEEQNTKDFNNDRRGIAYVRLMNALFNIKDLDSLKELKGALKQFYHQTSIAPIVDMTPQKQRTIETAARFWSNSLNQKRVFNQQTGFNTSVTLFDDVYTAAGVYGGFDNNSWANVFVSKLETGMVRKITIDRLYEDIFNGDKWMDKNIKNVLKLEKKKVNISSLSGAEMTMAQAIFLRSEIQREILRNHFIDAGLLKGEKTNHFALGFDVFVLDSARALKEERIARGSNYKVSAEIGDLFTEIDNIIKQDDFAPEYLVRAEKFFTQTHKFINDRYIELNGVELRNDGDIILEKMAEYEDGESFMEGLPAAITKHNIKNMYVPFLFESSVYFRENNPTTFGDVLDVGVFDGMTKEIGATNNRVAIDSMSRVLEKYKGETGNYYGLHRVMHNFNLMMSYKLNDFEQSTNIAHLVGNKAISYFQRLMLDMAGYNSKSDDGRVQLVLSFVRRNFYTTALGTNIKVLFTQFASLITLSNVYGGSYAGANQIFMTKMLKNMATQTTAKNKEDIAYLEKNSNVFWDRKQNSTFEMGQAASESVLTQNKFNRFLSKTMVGISFTDTAINTSFYLTLLETINPETGKEYTRDEAIVKVEEGILRSQSTALNFAKSPILRSQNEIIRVLMKFQGEPNKMITRIKSTASEVAYIKKVEKNQDKIIGVFDGQVSAAQLALEKAETALTEASEVLLSPDTVQKSKKEQMDILKDYNKKKGAVRNAEKSLLTAEKQLKDAERTVSRIISNKPAAKKALRHRLGAFQGAITWMTLLSLAFSNLRTKGGKKDKEADEDYLQYQLRKIGDAFVSEVFGMIPFLNTAFEAWSGYNASEIDELGSFNDIIQLTEQIFSGIAQGKRVNWASLSRKFAIALGRAMGIPVTNIERIVTTPLLYINEAAHYTYTSEFLGRNRDNIELKEAIKRNDTKMITTIINKKIKSRGVEVSAQVNRELIRLAGKGEEVSITGIREKFTHDGVEYTMTSKQEQDFAKVYNGADPVIKRLLLTPEYRKLNDAKKKKLIKSVYNYYYRKAKQDVFDLEIIPEKNYYSTFNKAYNFFKETMAKLYDEQLEEIAEARKIKRGF